MASSGAGLSVVLAGGGCKTFWGMGVLRSLEDMLPPVQHYAGTSAGAIMALVKVSERVDARLPGMSEIRELVEREYLVERRNEIKDLAYAKLREGYDVTIEEATESQ